jgi:hypothetical protein
VKFCDPEPIAIRLRTLDTANGIGWLGWIDSSSEGTDESQVRAGVLAVANSQRFDIYWSPMIVGTTHAIVETHKMDSLQAVVTVLGMVSAQAIPAYRSLSKACKGYSLKDAEMLAACRRVSAVLRRGDTYIAEMIGLAIAKRVWPERSPEYQDAVVAHRVLRYRMDMDVKISARHQWTDAYAAQYLELLATHRTEQEVALAEIVSAGIDPNPPEDWKDPLPSP